MPMFRRNGSIKHENTSLSQPSDVSDASMAENESPFTAKTRIAGSIPEPIEDSPKRGQRVEADSTDPTQLCSEEKVATQNSATDDNRTRLMIHGASDLHNRSSGHEQVKPDDVADVRALCEEPVVGWLVVIDGPGRGRSVQIGHGMNTVGRSPENDRIVLDFGDDQISRSAHTVITFDPIGRKFYISPGDGKNLAYIGEQPVLTARELSFGDDIRLGSTVVRFVPFCDVDFEWQA